MKPPDWNKVMKDCGGSARDDNKLVKITRGSLRLVLPLLRKQNAEDYYHNYGAAEEEIHDALGLKWEAPLLGGD